MALKPCENMRAARRLLLLQVLLNFRTMQGGGYVFVLWPWLKHADHRENRVRATAGFINSHPVMASLAAGAIRRRLENGDADSNPADLSEWKSSLSGPLGMVGDALIWDRWKPIVFAFGALITLLWPSIDLWLAVAASCLLVYNIPLGLLRVWGVREGYRLGESVLTALHRPVFTEIQKPLGIAGAVIAGLFLGRLLWSAGSGVFFGVPSFAIAFTVTAFGLRRNLSLMYIAPLAVILAFAAGLIIG